MKLDFSSYNKPPVGFLIGNGSSRKHIDLEKLKKYGYTGGCNFIYKNEQRNFIPDILVAIDQKPIREITKDKPNTLASILGIYTHDGSGLIKNDRFMKRLHMLEDINNPSWKVKRILRFSGSTLGFVFSLIEPNIKTVYLIGMDNDGFHAYADTKEKPKSGNKFAKDFLNIFMENANTNYIWIAPENIEINEYWKNVENLTRSSKSLWLDKPEELW